MYAFIGLWEKETQVHHFQWFLELRLAAKRINLDIDSCGDLLGYTEEILKWL